MAGEGTKIVKTQGLTRSQAKTGGRGRSKEREGTVISNKMNKTVVVRVTNLTKHPMYEKYVHRSNKFYAHDEKGECGVGDLVRIVETRPLSKTKRWKVVKVVRKVQ